MGKKKITKDNAFFDAVYRRVRGPQKMKFDAVAKEYGVSYDTIRRIMTAFDLVGEGKIYELKRTVAIKDACVGAIPWAFECHGKKIPEDFFSDGVSGKQEKDDEQLKAQDDNLAVLAGKVNELLTLVASIFAEERKQTRLMEEMVKLWKEV